MTGANPVHWRALLQNPMLVSDAVLGTLLQLQQADRQVKELHAGVTEFYIRSYTLSATQLGKISDIFIAQGELVPEAMKWKEVVRSVPGNTPCFVRYCGTTSSVTPWQRQGVDFSQKVTPAARFPQVMSVYYPAVVTNLTIFVLSKARVTFAIQNAHVDIRERALVALMGKPTLLNRQKGGKYPDIRPTMEDAQSFGKFGTKVLSLMEEASPCSSATTTALMMYADAAQQYANQHPNTTGTSSHAFTHEYKRIMLYQALPMTIKGTSYCPMILLGHDVLVGSFREAKSFFQMDIFGSHLVRTIVNWLATLELNKSKLADGFAKSFHLGGKLPFANLYQWFKKSREDLPRAIALLRQYLQAANPLVAMTWGEQTTSTAIGSFQHDRGIREGDLGFFVGRPLLCNYAADPQNIKDDDWVVIVPSYHPSAGAYGNAEHLLVDLFMKTMMIVWACASIGMELPSWASKLQRCEAILERVEDFMGPNTDFDRAFQTNKQEYMKSQSRSERAIRPITVLRDVIISHKHVEREYDDLESADLDDELDLDSERWKLSRDQLKMIAACGQPQSHPYTLSRRKEGKQLFYKRYAAMNTSKTGASMNAFISWSEGVRGEDQYYFAATSLSDRTRHISELLSIFLPDTVRDPNDLVWLHDTGLVRCASTALEQWVHDKIFPHAADSDHAIERAMSAWETHMQTRNPRLYQHLKATIDVQLEGAHSPPRYDDPNQKIHGQHVSVLPTGASGTRPALIFEWRDPQGDLHKLKASGDESQILLLPGVVMPLFVDESRSIYFLRQGIDIRDADGTSLRSTGDPVTVPLSSIFGGLDNPMQAQLLALWSRETGFGVEEAVFAEYENVPDPLEGIFAYPASAFTGNRPGEPLRTLGLMQALDSEPRGVAITNKFKSYEQAMAKKIKAYLPIQAGDALWLVHRFLEETYPTGGIVDAAESRLHPFADTIFKRLVDFCKQPKYRNHPQLVGVLLFAETACMPSITPGCVNVIRVILTILRTPVRETKSRVYNKLLKAQKTKYTFTIGTNVPKGKLTPGLLPLEDEEDEVLEQTTRTVDPDDLMGVDEQIDIEEDNETDTNTPTFPGRPIVKKTGHRRRKGKAVSGPVAMAESDNSDDELDEDIDAQLTVVARGSAAHPSTRKFDAGGGRVASRESAPLDMNEMEEDDADGGMPAFPARAKVTKPGRGRKYQRIKEFQRAKASALQTPAPNAGMSKSSGKALSGDEGSAVSENAASPSNRRRANKDITYTESAAELPTSRPSAPTANALVSAKSTGSKRKRYVQDDDEDDSDYYD
jgi:hypothetical protein